VTDPGGVLLDREQLERAFTALGDRLVRRGVVADVFIVGGAAMALAYDATRVTRDVDSLFIPHGVVLEEAWNVAQELGLPRWWLRQRFETRWVLGVSRTGIVLLEFQGVRGHQRAAPCAVAARAVVPQPRDLPQDRGSTRTDVPDSHRVHSSTSHIRGLRHASKLLILKRSHIRALRHARTHLLALWHPGRQPFGLVAPGPIPGAGLVGHTTRIPDAATQGTPSLVRNPACDAH
jgi:hypothetical protein